MKRRFIDRRDAGQRLARQLDIWANRHDVVVLALPCGGVPVAFEIAARLHAPLDVLPVCKLGVPWQPELAMGALSSGNAQFIDHDLIHRLGITSAQLDAAMADARNELERREQRYRGERPPVPVRNRIAIVVDDGMATGASLKAAVRALAASHPARIIVALPVAPVNAQARLGSFVDELVCMFSPASFLGVSQFYADFAQVTDDEVRDLLAQAPSAPDSA